jgi:hypothetical protein
MKQFNTWTSPSEFGPDWTDIKGCPNRAPDYGWGLMQITKPKPGAPRLWNWKSNIDKGMGILNDKDTNASARWTNYLSGWYTYNANHQGNQALGPIDRDINNQTFSMEPDQGDHYWYDANLMKAYNGASRPGGVKTIIWDYYRWNVDHWEWWPINGLGANYVWRVMKFYDDCSGN